MKAVVITGASKGIGLATAKKFLSEDWRVIGTYLNTPTDLNHPNLTSIFYDQGDPESITSAVAKITSIAPHIDALINNAAIILDNRDSSANAEKVRTTLEINVVGVVDFTENLLILMGEGSHIVNIDSTYGAFSVPIDDETSTAYRMAKAALNMYTRTLAYRLATQGIIVSSLDPGWVKTDMGMSVASETDKPDKDPEQPAQEIFTLVTTVTETGYFWRFNKKREW
jgi:NAD(P)-dependent dehydrogenase (short-subunit alcohol dehydrogenase family)